MDEKHRQILEDLANLIESDKAPQSITFGGGAAKFTVEAIRAALAYPSDGYVLMPVPPTDEMLVAAGKVVFHEAGQQWGSPTEFAESFVIDVQRKCHAAMIAARPEVP